VVGQNVVIGNGAKLHNVVIGDNCEIAAETNISDQKIP
jgi:carbonic anhydrase/acetyltransferase-like protein (isoleucine patch superfamily)